MKGQKEAVIDEVLVHLPTFKKYTDNAILLLTEKQLEIIKATIHNSIMAGTIEYSKDKSNNAEVRSYARSMVMNHLKKAKELNGGHIFNHTTGVSTSTGGVQKTVRVKVKIAPKGVNTDILPDDLKELCKTLV